MLDDLMYGGDYYYEIYGPGPEILGELAVTFVPIPNCPQTLHFIYLAPALEDHPEEIVLGTVAHELAHAVLNHMSPKGQRGQGSIEAAADALASQWGFAKEVVQSRHAAGSS